MNALKDDLSPTDVIYTQGLTKKFGEETALQSVDMQIPQGTVFGFIGPSGSGKTTTVRLMTGVYEPTSGSINVLGKDPTRFSASDREKIGYLPQQFVLYPNLTVWENLNFAASFYGVSIFRRGRMNRLLDFVELSDHKGKLAGSLSGGMKRRLSLAATLIHDPELVFLDEPTAGIDPILRRKFWDYFKELQTDGHTLFITTQYVGEAAYCDLLGVLHEGRLLAMDTPEGLRRKAYGGEVISLQTAEWISLEQRQQLQNLPFTQGKAKAISERELEIVVDEASTAIPLLIEWCKQENLTVETIEQISPPYEDVFVKLIKTEDGTA